MLGKSLIFLTWAVASYVALVFWATSWWQAVPLAVSLAFAMAGIGFSVQHDGGHGAYCESHFGNRLAAAALDFIGASSYFWNQKHNILHHTHTNVEDVDDDLDARPFLRMTTCQPRHWFHRYQHIYSLMLIGAFFSTKWAIFDDFSVWAKGKIGDQRIPRPHGFDVVQLLFGKVWFLIWAFIIPLSRHDFPEFMLAYFIVFCVQGAVLGLVFQLAHAVDTTEIVAHPRGSERLPRPFFEHQLATTSDFAPRNKLVTWYVGGLNFQVEHHLFPKISHLHYPAICEIVREVCAKHGIKHLQHETLGEAIASHMRFMKAMGRGEESPAIRTSSALPARA
jgi:linoleoyl-CoA desaturase